VPVVEVSTFQIEVPESWKVMERSDDGLVVATKAETLILSVSTARFAGTPLAKVTPELWVERTALGLGAPEDVEVIRDKHQGVKNAFAIFEAVRPGGDAVAWLTGAFSWRKSFVFITSAVDPEDIDSLADVWHVASTVGPLSKR
jgi:hypothetical protein